jgi:hypothetical protein
VSLARAALDLAAVLADPGRGSVDSLTSRRLEGEMVQSERVAVHRLRPRLGSSLAKAQRAVPIRAPEIVDRLPALALLFDHADPTERPQQAAIEREASLGR